MNRLTNRLQLALLEYRTVRAIVWFVAIGVLLYLVSVFCFGWQEIMTSFATLGLQTLLTGAVLSSSSYFWRFGRWEYSLQTLDSRVPKLAHLGIYLSGLALTATPGKFGETLRSALLIQHGVRVAHSLAAFLVDRGSDVLGMILLGTLGAVMVSRDFAWVWLMSFALVLLGSIGLAILLLHPIANEGWGRIFRSIRWLPVKGGQATLEAWAKVWTLRRALVFAGIAMLAYGTQALVFSWFCNVLGTGIPVADCVLIFVQATLFGAASMIPGGLGAMEAALVFQLVERGVSDGIAISLAISIRLVTLWLGVALGLLSLVCLSFSVQDTSSKNDEF